jgi:hypothetical protein
MCIGAVTPKVEDCTTPEDDDCDGTPNQATAGCVCLPATSRACNSDPNKANIGICKDGHQDCLANGKGYAAACIGEVMPAASDDCTNNLDDDCSGTYCTQPRWVDDFGGAPGSTVFPAAAAADASGNVFVVGNFKGNLKIGGNNLVGVSAYNDGFIAKLDSLGNLVWIRQYGGNQGVNILGVAVDSAGNVVAAGDFGDKANSGTISFDGGITSVASASGDGFVVKLSAAGSVIWSQILGEGGAPNGFQSVTGVAIDNNNDVIVTGTFESGLVVKSLAKVTAFGTPDLFVAKLKGLDGKGSWVVSPSAGSGSHAGKVVRTDASGNILIGGTVKGSMTLAGHVVTASAGGNDVFVGRLTPAGLYSWIAPAYGNGKYNYLGSLAVDSTGAVIFAGSFVGGLNLGGPSQLTNPSLTNYNIFVAKLTKAGAYSWQGQFGSSAAGTFGHEVDAVTVDSSDSVYVSGVCDGQFDVGANLVCPPSANAFLHATPMLIRLSSAGALSFNRTYGANAGSLPAIAWSSPSTLWAAGTNNGGFDFGSGPKPSLASAGAFGQDLIISSIVAN